MHYEHASIRGGGSVEFEVSSPAGVGGMKQVFFVKGRQQVVAFYLDARANVAREARLASVLGRLNPTRDGQTHAEHWRELFCWPTHLVDHATRGVGLLMPAYPPRFVFRHGLPAGKEKRGEWYTCIDRASGKPFHRVHVDPSERGSLRTLLEALLSVARAVRRLHAAGLAHSDLSEANVLIDAAGGRGLVVDVDALVVENEYPPDVLGTPGYIAPEVMATKHLPMQDPNRRHPSAITDRHALAVLIYKYLLARHPLEGRKIHSGMTAEREDDLVYGSKAVYSEHREDESNRPMAADFLSAEILGARIANLFHQAFVDGMIEPRERPLPGAWESALESALDSLVRCSNPSCDHGEFVLTDERRPRCPYCGSPSEDLVVRLMFQREDHAGWFRTVGSLVLSAPPSGVGLSRIFRHHVDRGSPRWPAVEPAPLAEVVAMEAPRRGLYLHNVGNSVIFARSAASGRPYYSSIAPTQKLLLGDELEIRFGTTAKGMRAFSRLIGTATGDAT